MKLGLFGQGLLYAYHVTHVFIPGRGPRVFDCSSKNDVIETNTHPWELSSMIRLDFFFARMKLVQ
jgi:hypothetical protein